MKLEFTVAVDVSEQYVELLDRMQVGGSLGHFRNIVQRELNEVKEEFPDIIASVFVDAADSQSEQEGGNGQRQIPRPPTHREFGDRGVAVASEPRPARSGGMAPPKVSKGTGGVRTGRPATLHDYEASDGQPVRAAGPRSAEVLRTQGIAVRKVGKEWPGWYTAVEGRQGMTREQQPTPKVQSKSDRPPVIQRRRGQ